MTQRGEGAETTEPTAQPHTQRRQYIAQLLLYEKLITMTANQLFDLAETLDKAIATLETEGKTFKELYELSDLKAYRAYVQEGIEAAVSAMESNTGE